MHRAGWPVRVLMALLTTGAAAGPAGGACPAGEVEIGAIDDFEGAAEGYLLLRRGEECTVKPLMPVFQGDRIRVRTRRGLVRIQFHSGGRREFRRGRTVVLKSPAPRGPTIPGRIFKQLIDQLSRSRALGYHATGARGGGSLHIAMKSVKEKRARIAAGSRNFVMAWRGGKALHRVKLFREDSGEAMLDEKRIDGIQLIVLSRKINFTPGTYRVEIFDKTGAKVEGAFTAVHPADVPEPPPDLTPDWYSKEAKLVVEAHWLARRENGIWAYEALLRLAPISRDYETARDLMRLIGGGSELKGQ